MIKFSIVTPTFNRVDYLSQMIEGILRQVYDNWELIVVNDGGTDSTSDLMEYYCNLDKRIKYFKRKKNMGIAYTRNEGNSHAAGDWIVVCDSDEIWIPERLELTAKFIKKYPDVEFISGGIYWMSNEGTAIREYWRPKPLTAAALRDGKQVIIHGASSYKKSLADRIPYRNEQRINDDFWFVVDCWNAKVKFGYLDRPLMGYRILSDGVSHTNFKKIKNEIKQKLKKEYIRDE